jgi:hypothetical protein
MNDLHSEYFGNDASMPPTPDRPVMGKDRGAYSIVFIHSRLDDHGLSAAEFRVFCHISRRAGNGEAYSSIKEMSAVCRLHPQTVRAALRFLTAHRMLSQEIHPGHTSRYRLASPSDWKPIRRQSTPSEANSHLLISQGSPMKAGDTHPCETNRDKGYPYEGNPMKEIHTPIPPEGDVRIDEPICSVLPEETIYDAYPKKIGRPVALRVIRKAIESHGFEFILERTRLFANSYNGDPQYVPNPARWFNEQRFADDPTTWRKSVGTVRRPKLINATSFSNEISKL